VPIGEGSLRDLVRVVGVCLALACAALPWPDEPGVPVEVSQASNVDAGDVFLAALTDRRRTAGRPAPLVASRYQADIRTFALDLQSGRISATVARRAIESWGQAAYGRTVESWAIDCAAGDRMPIPPQLIELPSAVISYAAAHFRPRSLAQGPNQCAILTVALTGDEPVTPTAIK
jgi:hypothetical protein